MPRETYFVIGHYGDGNHSALGLETRQSIKECKQMIEWQNGADDDFHICTADPDNPETFIAIKTGERYKINRGPFKQASYDRFCSGIWTDYPPEAASPGFR
jgi:hypothetical protein